MAETNPKPEDYQIAICQDGKFAVTFNTGKIHYSKEFILKDILNKFDIFSEPSD